MTAAKEPKKSAVRMLGPDEFLSMGRNSFASVYMTLASIVQGVALGTLVVTGSQLMAKGHYESFIALSGPLLVIVYVWFTSIWVSLQFTWLPHILDPVALFAIGLIECAVILTIEHPAAYLYCAGVLAVLGVIDTVHMEERADIVYVADFWRRWDEQDQKASAIAYACAALAFFTAAVLLTTGAWKPADVPWWLPWHYPVYLPAVFMLVDVIGWGWRYHAYVEKYRYCVDRGLSSPDEAQGPNLVPEKA